MNQNGQVMIENIFVTTLISILLLGLFFVFFRQKQKLKHEDSSRNSAPEAIADFSQLESLGLTFFESNSTAENVKRLVDSDWEVYSKFADKNGNTLVLVRRGNEGLIINKGIGVKLCLENCP